MALDIIVQQGAVIAQRVEGYVFIETERKKGGKAGYEDEDW